MTDSREAEGAVQESSLREASEVYLRTLRTEAPEPTFYSQQTALRKFRSWNGGDELCWRPEVVLTRFAEYLFEEQKLAIDTVKGHIYSLLNFLAFYEEKSPAVLRSGFVSNLTTTPDSGGLYASLRDEFAVNLSKQKHRAVRNLRWYLRRRHYGTREHAFVALIHSTAAPPSCIQTLDCSDYENDQCRIKVDVSKTHLVAEVDLLNERVVSLTPELREILESYLEYERKTPDCDDEPLFATNHGRASLGTLRRAVETAGHEAQKQAGAPSEAECDGSGDTLRVLPSDVWKAALKETGEMR
jgi:integrase